jgi:hypothetical protein
VEAFDLFEFIQQILFLHPPSWAGSLTASNLNLPMSALLVPKAALRSGPTWPGSGILWENACADEAVSA